MASPLDRLDEAQVTAERQLAVLRGQLTTLTEQIDGLEKQLERLAIAREVFMSLPADRTAAVRPRSNGAHLPDHGGDTSPVLKPRKPVETDERIMVIMASAGRTMRAREVAHLLGEPDRRGRVETTRARLKRLVAAGRLVQPEPGLFSIVTGINGSAMEGAADTDKT